ncbi:MAG: cation transporter [Bacteroidales bacterium]|nr:cation transporter [Bacteroidales bacterium]
MNTQYKLERKALKFSLLGTVFMAILGFVFAWITDSTAILLDGTFSSVNILLAFTTIIVSRKVTQKESNRFQFRLYQLEPLLNVFKSLFYLVVIILAISTAAIVIYNGGRPIRYNLGVFYALIAMSGCFAMSYLVKWYDQKESTPLLAIEYKGWFIDALLSGAVLITFLIGYLFRDVVASKYLNYIDPIVSISIGLSMIPLNIKMLKNNALDLLYAAPDQTLQNQISSIIRRVTTKYNCLNYHIRLAKTGRITLLYIGVLQEHDLDIHRESIRNELITAFNEKNLSINLVMESFSCLSYPIDRLNSTRKLILKP